MADDKRGAIIPGAILIALGLAFFAMQYVPGLGGEVVLVALGLAFIVAFFAMRQFGFAVPGGILTGLGAGVIAERFYGAGMVVLGLGIGFVLVWLLDTVYTHASNWWPLIPGGILIAVGLGSTVPALQDLLRVGWPLILIVAGLLLVAGALGVGRRRKP